MNEDRTTGLGLASHVLLGACLSVVAISSFCVIMGGVPEDANERFTLYGRLPIYTFHFALPGMVLGAIAFGVRRLLRRRREDSERPA
jgi:hypothetical protein